MATVTPAGPDNPLGKYMMRLAKRTYLIHSTNAPWGVGRRSSGGCIRMYPSSIEALFGMVPVGTQVRIINDPVKTGWESSHLYLESHVPVDFKTRRAHEMIPLASTVVRKELLNKNVDINWNTFVQVARAQQGIPQDIGVAY
jgi:L,D-transpeptidase ErfK/SrfK